MQWITLAEPAVAAPLQTLATGSDAGSIVSANSEQVSDTENGAAVAMTALVVALAGTGYAAVKINGKDLVSHSVPGGKINKNNVTGAEVRESSLPIVPRATGATTADSATAAGTAATATRADTAGRADTAAKADSATTAGSAGSAATAAKADSATTADSASDVPDLVFENLTLVNDWAAYAPETYAPETYAPETYAPAAALDAVGVVHLRGAMATTGGVTIPSVLPGKFRPAKRVYVGVDLINGKPGRINIEPNGTTFVQSPPGDHAGPISSTSRVSGAA